METTEKENIRNAEQKIIYEFMEWLKWLSAGKGYSEFYYKDAIKREYEKYKKRLKEND